MSSLSLNKRKENEQIFYFHKESGSWGLTKLKVIIYYNQDILRTRNPTIENRYLLVVPVKGGKLMKVLEVVKVLRLCKVDVLLLELLKRILGALIKKLIAVRRTVKRTVERLKAEYADK